MEFALYQCVHKCDTSQDLADLIGPPFVLSLILVSEYLV